MPCCPNWPIIALERPTGIAGVTKATSGPEAITKEKCLLRRILAGKLVIDEIEEAVASERLAHLVKDIREGGQKAKAQPKGKRSFHT
ncbi:hypothetical protein Tco_1290697 [Tanacetum coccineum]